MRVFVFAAAFPFFNNVDEQAHVDLVIKYSHLDLPHGLEPMSPESAQYFSLYGTYEYFRKAEDFPGGKFPLPLWMRSQEERDVALPVLIDRWKAMVNHETGEPPLYYAVAGLFWKVGSICGLRGLALLYLVRFLNIAIAIALVWLGYIAGRLVFPEKIFLASRSLHLSLFSRRTPFTQFKVTFSHRSVLESPLSDW